MGATWDDNQPIYWQLREQTIAGILDGSLAEGEALPSVRQVAAELQVNPITVSRAYQSLLDDDLVERRRGLGMFVTEGARSKLLASEREKFLNEEWPRVRAHIQRLGLKPEQLLNKEFKDD